jgi:hypothetical protein
MDRTPSDLWASGSRLYALADTLLGIYVSSDEG